MSLLHDNNTDRFGRQEDKIKELRASLATALAEVERLKEAALEAGITDGELYQDWKQRAERAEQALDKLISRLEDENSPWVGPWDELREFDAVLNAARATGGSET